MTPNHELFRLIYQLAEAKAPTLTATKKYA